MTVDRISGGRLELGIGAGASAYDWTMTSGAEAWPAAERVARFAEAVQIVDGLLRGTLRSFAGRHYQLADVCLAPGPVQQPRPRLVIAAGGPRMVKLAARYADAWVTEGAYPELRGGQVTMEDHVRITGERAALLSEEAAALGRDPAALGRIFLVGFSPLPATPWASVAAFEELIGRHIELGFDEFVLPEPTPTQWPLFERIATEVIPRLGGRCPECEQPVLLSDVLGQEV
jgi:alkanesulfonate monooxygenase SsuD/methylene tetrahydromethanopterin reductase-like flavin-dependent oxidoreductase (luciferase family)